MEQLKPNETKLVGKWEVINGKVVGNYDCERIEELIASDLLEKIAYTDGGWTILYKDKTDGRYWELSYPQGELHGGGPPSLTNINIEEVVRKYKLIGDEELEKTIHKEKEMVKYAYEQAKSFSNIIMMGGYAGLFAVWSFTKSYLVYWQAVSVGLLTLVSLAFFVSFEIYREWRLTTSMSNWIKRLEEAQELNSDRFLKKYGEEESKKSIRLIRVWPFFFWPSLITALSAALILIWVFVSKLVCA